MGDACGRLPNMLVETPTASDVVACGCGSSATSEQVNERGKTRAVSGRRQAVGGGSGPPGGGGGGGTSEYMAVSASLAPSNKAVLKAR